MGLQELSNLSPKEWVDVKKLEKKLHLQLLCLFLTIGAQFIWLLLS
jgi:hypothetical protein